MDRWNGLVAVVTGASSGIGRATALRLAEEGMRVAALARRLDKLEELSSSFKGKGEIHAYKCDISKEEEIQETFSKIEKEMGQVRVLINNAGMVLNSSVKELEIEKYRNLFDVNFFGPLSCTRQVLKSAEKNDPGLVHILTINSVAGHFDLAVDSSYYRIYQCSKKNLLIMGRALYRELAKDKKNIRITSVSPGYVATELAQSSGRDMTTYSGWPSLKSEEVVEAVITQISAPDNILIAELIIEPSGEIL